MVLKNLKKTMKIIAKNHKDITMISKEVMVNVLETQGKYAVCKALSSTDLVHEGETFITRKIHVSKFEAPYGMQDRVKDILILGKIIEYDEI